MGERFWGEVFGTRTERVGETVGLDVGLGQPKITNFDMAVSIDEQILRLEVAIDDALLMQIL